MNLLEPTDLIMADSDFTMKEDLMVGGLHWKSHHHLIAAIQLAYKLQKRGNRACMAQHAVGLAPSPNVRYYIFPVLTDSFMELHKKLNPKEVIV